MAFCSSCGQKLEEGARFCASCGTSSVPGGAAPVQDEDKKKFDNFVLRALKNNGITDCSADDDGDIVIKNEFGTYILFYNKTFLNMIYPAFWELNDDDSRQLACVIAGVVNRETLFGKVILVGGDGIADATNVNAQFTSLLYDASGKEADVASLTEKQLCGYISFMMNELQFIVGNFMDGINNSQDQ